MPTDAKIGLLVPSSFKAAPPNIEEYTRFFRRADRYILDLEHKYGLMDKENVIDPRTATVEAPLPTRNGKVQTEELLKNEGKVAA